MTALETLDPLEWTIAEVRRSQWRETQPINDPL